MKNRYKFILALAVTSTILSLILAVKSFSYAVELNNKVLSEDVNNLYYSEFITYFDVTDFSNKDINKIDIVSKRYDKNTISILDSNFILSKKLSDNIYNTINNYGANNSFYLVSLNDGMSIGYNIDTIYETASSIKAPYALYLYKEIDAGRINKNNLITYKNKHYNRGTGIVKNNKFGTKLSVGELIYDSLYYSDNVAHTMLHDEFDVTGYNKMLRGLGTKQLYLSSSSPWGFTSPRSAAIVWQDIYNFSITSDEGVELLNILSNVRYNYFDEVVPDIPSASKAGFASKDVIVTGIIFDEYPYIAIAVANTGGNSSANKQVIELIGYMNSIMKEYKVYKNKTS